MKLHVKKAFIVFLGLVIIIGIIASSLVPALSQKELLRYRENEEVKGLTTSTFSQTKAIIEAHKNDFNVNNFDQVMASHGGYKGYLNDLGGVFKKYANFEGKVTTYSELEEVANYVFGIMAIWGFDYSANGGDRYYSYYDENARFYPNRQIYGEENYGTEGIDAVASKTGGHGMLANCNCGVDWTLRKAGLMEANDAVSYDFYDEFGQYQSTMQKYDAQKITDPNKVQPGDIIIMKTSEGGFHTELVVARDDFSGKYIMYDSGSVALARNGGQLTDRYKNERNIGDEPWPWPVNHWYAVRLPFGLTNDTDGVWETTNSGTKYRRSNGSYPKNEWVKIVGQFYHFDGNEYLQKGLTKINNKGRDVWYYLSPDDGRMLRGWQTVNGYKRYFAQKQTDKYVYGEMYIGLNDIYNSSDGNTYTYYFDKDGKMVTEFVEVNNATYYFDENGRMKTGWLIFKDDGPDRSKDEKYYFSEDSATKGQMAIGWKNIEVKISGVSNPFWFYFVENDNQYNGFNKGRALLGERLVTRNGKENYYYFCVTNAHVEGYPAGAMIHDMEFRGKRYDSSGAYIDEIEPQVEIIYSTKEATSGNVQVTIKANEKVKEIDGWNLSADGLTLTKEYSDNNTENIPVSDIAGNTTVVEIEVNNIDKIGPELNIIYSETELTNKGVLVTIKTNEKVQAIEGWTIDTEGKKLTKEYRENVKEEVEISDILGNKRKATIEISNIYETSLVESNYKVDSDIIVVNKLGETVENFKKNNVVKAKSIKVINTQGIEINDGDIIGTGYKFVLDGELVYRIAVLGDSNGDGKATISELARIQRTILDSIELDEIELKALDFNETGRLEVSDLAKECRIILGG